MSRILLHHARLPESYDATRAARWAASLPPPRARRLARRRVAADRLASLVGLALLLDCAAAAGLPVPAAGDLELPAGGKPRWRGGPDFSIAHAGGRVACALATGPVAVGLDLEPVTGAAWEDLRLVATPSEAGLYRARGLGPAALWTAKEAVLKAAGQPAPRAAQVHLLATVAWLDQARFVLCRPWLAPGFSCTLATTGPVRVVRRVRPAAAVLARLA